MYNGSKYHLAARAGTATLNVGNKKTLKKMTYGSISDKNPCLDEMKDQGWAWIHRSSFTDSYGAPHTNDIWAEDAEKRYELMEEDRRNEVRIITWEDHE